ncbi:Serine/threonine protein kinase, partial [Globisporangium splendens]
MDENSVDLNQYSQVIARFHQFITKHGCHNFATHVVLCLRVAESIAQFHDEIDRIESRLRLPPSSPSPETMVHDRETHLKSFDGICRTFLDLMTNIRNDRARFEALTLVLNVLRNRSTSRDENVNVYCVRFDALDQFLTSCSDSPPDTIVADWFVPPHLVDCDDESFRRGSFGKVYHATVNGGDVVVKQLLVDDDDEKAQFLEEVNIWSQMRHPHILAFLGACHIGRSFFVSWEKLYEVALGLKYLHDRHIIHGDLKGNNSLVGADGKAKLADFGLSLVIANSLTLKPAKVGALRWRSPEVSK